MVNDTIRKVNEEETLKEFICKICLEPLTENEVIPLENCEHVFHAECVEMFVKT